jgi:SAM-dependent methyltransferase
MNVWMRVDAMFSDVPIERVQEFWDKRPCNLRHSPAPLGSREYFEEVTERKYRVEPHIPRFAQFEKWRGKRVLEIGCGIGTDTIRFAQAGADVTAVDLSERSLAIARQRAELYGAKVRFYRANAEELSSVVPKERYDLVYSFGVIHHTPHPERVLRELRTHYLAQGSTLKLMLYHRHSYKVLWILLRYGYGAFWKTPELVATHSEAQTGCPVTYSYTPAEVRRLLAGMRIDELFVDHIFPYRIPDYVQYRYRKTWYFAMLPAPLMRALERRFGWHLCVTATA